MSERNEPIAIVGMRGRFPGADDLDQFWRNLAEGVESITLLSPDDMRAAGIPDQITRLPGYVNASPLLERHRPVRRRSSSASPLATLRSPIPSTASSSRPLGRRSKTRATTRPQYPGPIGVFGGCELSTYLYHLAPEPRRPRIHRRHAADGHQRQGPSLHAGVVPAQPARPERRRADHLLHVAGGRRPGVREPAGRPLRHGAGRRRDRQGSPARRLLLRGRLDPVARRPLPPLRRQRPGHHRRQRRRPRRAEAARATPSPTATTSAP